jgi:hypothetical protein
MKNRRFSLIKYVLLSSTPHFGACFEVGGFLPTLQRYKAAVWSKRDIRFVHLIF